MNNIKIFNFKGESTKQINFELSSKESKIYSQAMFDQVIAENAGKRQGTHSTLTKAEVRGGGRKPLQQKHTGRARQGSIRNPHWVGGGVAFGPKPTRNYKLKINAKVSQKAFSSAFNLKLKDNKIFIIENQKISKPSVKNALAFLKSIKLDTKKNLIITTDSKEAINLIKSFNNIPKNVAKKFNQVSVKDILNAHNLIIELSAIKEFGMIKE